MSEKIYEIAFSGQIVDGADLQSVKQKIAQIFKADEDRLTQMFSGRRVLIKRKADEITMIKYRGAFQKAGAICEVVDLSAGHVDVELEKTSNTVAEPAVAVSTVAADYVSKYPESDIIPQALLSVPIASKMDKIEDLAADIAPVGSLMQHRIVEVEEPVIDISEFDIAPVGSNLLEHKNEDLPPPPDTTGLSMAD